MISLRKSQHLESASLYFFYRHCRICWEEVNIIGKYRIQWQENIWLVHFVIFFCLEWTQTLDDLRLKQIQIPHTWAGNKHVPPFVHGQSMVPENAVISTSSLANLPSWFVGCKFYAVLANISLFKTGTKMSIPWLFNSHAAKPCSFWVYVLNKKVFVA